MNRTELINATMSKIDEVSPSDGLIVNVGLSDEKPIATIIDSLLNESAQEILMKAPVHKLPITKSTEVATANATTATIGTVKVPTDFLRIVEFKMKDWERSVSELHLPGSIKASQQSNKWLRGGPSKPVAVLTSTDTGNVIEYYSVKSLHTIDKYYYIKKDVAENVPVVLQDALCWLCASKALAIFKSAEGSKTALENAISLIQ